ncbi:molybdopterin molybdotransferase MoeA [Thermosulfidibacter takaii]|nr:gephyrin-like molybdotransferase Glp [Thermosulfidibacter takaii]
MERRVKYQQAKEIVFGSIDSLSTETVFLEEALGRVLAEDVIARQDIPVLDTSAMDGYAVNSGSITRVPCRLRIVGEVFAGMRPGAAISAGEACYVATGAFLPENADAVIRLEDAEVEDGFLVVREKPDRGQFVDVAGSEVKKGEKVISKGERINYRMLGLLARLGVYKLRVFRKPRVGIVVTGDEICEVFEPSEFRNRNANLYILRGLLEKERVDYGYLAKVGDDVDDLVDVLGSAFENYDVVVTTGGVSVGRKDLVKEALARVGARIEFTGTNVKPGRPLTFALYESKLFFGLPGYPSALLVNALEFLMPALRKLAGERNFENRYLEAVAAEDFKSRRGKVYFIRVNLRCENGVLKAYSAGSQLTSNYLTSALCDALLIVPEEKERVKKGEVSKVLIL